MLKTNPTLLDHVTYLIGTKYLNAMLEQDEIKEGEGDKEKRGEKEKRMSWEKFNWCMTHEDDPECPFPFTHGPIW